MNQQLTNILMWWKAESANTVRMIEAIPADKLNEKVDEKVSTAAEIAHHIAGSIKDLAESIEKGKAIFNPSGDVPTTVEELVQNYRSLSESNYAKFQELSDEDLARKIPMEFGGKVVWEPTVPEMMTGYICHEIHHRAHIGLIIRMLGGKVPGMYGPSADDM